jgi:hypothetical protein
MDRLHELAAKAAAFADLLDQNRPLFSDAVCKGSLRFRGAANVAIDPASLHPSFCAVEEQIETADVDITNYGAIVSPGTRKILRSTPSFPGGSITTWAEIRGGQSSPEVTGGRAFAGCWNNLTFCLWGCGVARGRFFLYSSL